MALWLCRAGRYGEHEAKFLEEGRIYLTWNGLNRDLRSIADRQELLKVLEEIYPKFTQGRLAQHASQIWTFAHKMNKGDWVALPSKRRTIHIGEITGDYTFVPDGPDPYCHYRNVNWLQTDIPRTNFDQDILHSLGALATICEIKRNDAEQRVRAMQKNDWKATPIKPRPTPGGNEDNGEPSIEDIDLEQIARDQIARLIYSRFAGHGMESLVESILKAQGFTTHRTGKGADGGIDILASPGVLGFGQPRICVQVKSQDSPLDRPVLDQLVGTMQHVGADQGLLVCWGGFKSTVLRELPRQFFKVRIWDQNDLIEQFLAHYDRLDEEVRAEIPLKRVWAVAGQDDDGE